MARVEAQKSVEVSSHAESHHHALAIFPKAHDHVGSDGPGKVLCL